MVHKDASQADSKPQIRQVEFNTIASSFGGLAAKVSGLHRQGSCDPPNITSLGLTVSIAIYFQFQPIHRLLHASSPEPPSLLIRLRNPFLWVLSQHTKRMDRRKLNLNYLFASSSLFKTLKITHSISMHWRAQFSKNTMFLLFASPFIKLSNIQQYLRISHQGR